MPERLSIEQTLPPLPKDWHITCASEDGRMTHELQSVPETHPLFGKRFNVLASRHYPWDLLCWLDQEPSCFVITRWAYGTVEHLRVLFEGDSQGLVNYLANSQAKKEHLRTSSELNFLNQLQ